MFTKENLAAIFKTALEGVILTDRNGEILYLNKSAQLLLGLVSDQTPKINLHDFLAASSSLLVKQALAGVNVADAYGYVTLTLKQQDQPSATISSSMRLENEQVLLIFRDISEAEALEQELLETKKFLENVIQSCLDAIIVYDLKGPILLFNQAAEKLLGYSAEEVIGKIPWSALYPAAEAQDILERLQGEAYGGKGTLKTLRKNIVTKEQQLIPVNVNAATLVDEQAQTLVVSILADLRELLEIENKLSAVAEQLQLSEQHALLIKLAGTAAHELNQPLTAILGYVEILKDKLTPEAKQDALLVKALEVITKEVTRMGDIVHKLSAITAYREKTYIGQSEILDIESATKP